MLRSSKALALIASVAAILVATPRAAHAASVQGTFTVTAAVVKNCIVTTNNIDLGNYDPTSTVQLSVTQNVSVSCTKGTSGVSIGLASTSWTLKDGSGNAIPYKIFQGATSTDWTATPWTGISFAAAKTAQNFGANAKPDVGVDVPVGTYTDTVTVTVTF